MDSNGTCSAECEPGLPDWRARNGRVSAYEPPARCSNRYGRAEGLGSGPALSRPSIGEGADGSRCGVVPTDG